MFIAVRYACSSGVTPRWARSTIALPNALVFGECSRAIAINDMMMGCALSRSITVFAELSLGRTPSNAVAICLPSGRAYQLETASSTPPKIGDWYETRLQVGMVGLIVTE